MPNLIMKNIQSIVEFTEFIDKKAGIAKEKKMIWYRGVRDATYRLVPRLYRDKRTVNELISTEETMANWFYERGIPYCARELNEDWEKLFFMQHFGVPTRLLDWTENPFIALYFALRPNNIKEDQPAAVWILDPCKWNKAATREMGGYEKIFFKDDQSGALNYYRLGQPLKGGELLPLAVYGTYNSYRIAAQRGVFTVFGSAKLPMEGYFRDSKRDFDKGCLSKVIIPNECKSNLYNSLLSFGITESTVLPDLDGLACETRRTFKFEE